MTRREIGPARKRFSGDVESAQQYVGQAMVLLGNVKEQMRMGGLSQWARQIILPNGVILSAISKFGIDEIQIFAPPPEMAGGIISREKYLEPVPQLLACAQDTDTTLQTYTDSYFYALQQDGSASVFFKENRGDNRVVVNFLSGAESTLRIFATGPSLRIFTLEFYSVAGVLVGIQTLNVDVQQLIMAAYMSGRYYVYDRSSYTTYCYTEQGNIVATAIDTDQQFVQGLNVDGEFLYTMWIDYALGIGPNIMRVYVRDKNLALVNTWAYQDATIDNYTYNVVLLAASEKYVAIIFDGTFLYTAKIMLFDKKTGAFVKSLDFGKLTPLNYVSSYFTFLDGKWFLVVNSQIASSTDPVFVYLLVIPEEADSFKLIIPSGLLNAANMYPNGFTASIQPATSIIPTTRYQEFPVNRGKPGTKRIA